MAKIGILTQPLGFNYGGILQNWALQQVLLSLGIQAVTIRQANGNIGFRIYKWVRALLIYVIKYTIKSPTRYSSKLPWDSSPFCHLIQFVKKHINHTSYLSLTNSNDILRMNLEKIIVGSDQVWRPRYNGKHLQSMYCDFLNDKSNISVITYAASFGVSNWEYSETETQMAQKEIAKFAAISVREESAILLCRKYLHRDAHLVLDPTLLLSKNKYEELISEKNLQCLPKKYIAVYILDFSHEKKTFVDTVCQKLGIEPFYFGNQSVDGKNIVPVETWLGAIMRSSFVITDSFHGTAFSINFRRPFISIINNERGADRFESLLKMFGLEERMVDISTNQQIDAIIDKQIIWHDVERIQEAERQNGLNFLKSNLR